MRLKVVITILAVLIISGVVFGFVRAKSINKPSAIPVGSTFAVAQAHSKGILPACLSKNASAEAAVHKDDGQIGTGNYATSAFDLATTMGLIDVPAGTHVDAAVHSYDGKAVTGSVSYPPKYGNYNFTIVPSSKAKPYSQWAMTSLFACRKG